MSVWLTSVCGISGIGISLCSLYMSGMSMCGRCVCEVSGCILFVLKMSTCTVYVCRDFVPAISMYQCKRCSCAEYPGPDVRVRGVSGRDTCVQDVILQRVHV